MNIRLKHILFAVLDVALAVYLFLAVTSFNKPKVADVVCSKVEINVADSSDAGFLSATEIRLLLKEKGLYPLGKKMSQINPRSLEEAMAPRSGGGGIPFVKTAECYKTENGHVCITITQRTPLIRVKSNRGDDYYLDDQGGTMPNSKYTSDLIIATGAINNAFAKYYVTPMARAIMANDFWKNQIEQINVLPDRGIELIPRVGKHIIYIGHLPTGRYKSQIDKLVTDYVGSKLDRTLKFYRYGLSKAGWNKYSYIDVELSNQIVCRKRQEIPQPVVQYEEDENSETAKPQTDEKTEEKAKENTEGKAKAEGESQDSNGNKHQQSV